MNTTTGLTKSIDFYGKIPGKLVLIIIAGPRRIGKTTFAENLQDLFVTYGYSCDIINDLKFLESKLRSYIFDPDIIIVDSWNFLEKLENLTEFNVIKVYVGGDREPDGFDAIIYNDGTLLDLKELATEFILEFFPVK